jgi:hypothetical protein
LHPPFPRLLHRETHPRDHGGSGCSEAIEKKKQHPRGGEVEPSTWGLVDVYTMWRFPEMGWNGGTPKSSILIGSIRNQPPMHNVVIFYILGIVMKYEKYWKMLPDTHIWWYMIQGTCLCLLVIKKRVGVKFNQLQ